MGMRDRVNEAGRSLPDRGWTRSELEPEVSGTTVFNSGQFTTTQYTHVSVESGGQSTWG